MEFIDVLFPINLGPLTYKCPDNLTDKALPGMLVSATPPFVLYCLMYPEKMNFVYSGVKK